jgi:hypothetical protein
MKKFILPPEEETRRLADYNQGFNDYELAKRWYLGHRAVQLWRHTRGLPCHPKQREVPKHYNKSRII